MKGQPEKLIENQVLSWLKFNQIFAFKVKSTATYDPKLKRYRKLNGWYRKGCPDVLVCHKGKFIGLEIKTPKGSLSVDQKLFHADIKQAGGQVFVVRDVKDLSPIFEKGA